jgi:membrane fusion protein, multidrug efflux system
MTNKANRWPFLAAALVIAIMAGGWVATRWSWVAGYLWPAAPPGASAAAAPVVPVTVVSAKVGSIPRIIAGIGIVSALQSVTVRSRIDGEVMEISFAEGRFAKAGDVLAQIDPRQLEAALAGAEAMYASFGRRDGQRRLGGVGRWGGQRLLSRVR